ncbi:hypothetical protein H4R18_002290 [Coemansia javaensis]|uniref:Integral membrane bound transporter domain-containing protein n=1 Tax=Coemansia javaensis TaxID=2761396 RepID=A0A9W8LK48_9FUNG|nr:hypothetical protein H4R18_002290 [Coemansia javaensis]
MSARRRDETETETQPLLGPSGSRKWRRRAAAAAAWAVPATAEQRAAVGKAVAAYAAAALFAFVPGLRELLGDPEYMAPHLVTNATIWFHAAKTRSGLIEDGLVGALWAGVTSAVTHVALGVAEALHRAYGGPAPGDGGAGVAPLAVQSKAASLGVFVFGYSWCLALFKANSGRPSVATATAIANVVLYLVMLREAPVVNYRAAAAAAAASRGQWPTEDDLAETVGKKAEHVLVAVLAGMAVSLAVGLALRPTTAAAALRRELAAALASLRAALPQPGAGPAAGAPEAALHAHRRQMQAVRRHLAAAALDPLAWHVWARRRRLAALADALAALGLRLAGIGAALEQLHAVGCAGGAALELRRIRAAAARFGAGCDAALAAVAAMVDGALDPAGRSAGSDDEDAAAVRADLAAAAQAFRAECAAAPAGAPRDGPVAEPLLAVRFYAFGLRELGGELDALVAQAAAASRAPPAVGAAVRRLAARGALAALARRAARGAWRGLRALCDTGATADLDARHEARGSLHAPRPRGAAQRARHRAWRALMWARRPNVKFATKYALLVTLLALPWYWSVDAYRELRRERLDWAVISAAAIMVPTVGGTALVSVYRVLGTCAGGLAAYAVYAADGRPSLPTYLMLVAVAAPLFHVMLHGRYPKIGQFGLLTFGVVLINKLIAREDRDESAAALAVRRTAAVALGVLAGMAVTMYVWPFEARVRLRHALSCWLLNAGQLYAVLWRPLWADAATPPPSDSRDRLSAEQDCLDAERCLQDALLEIRALLADTLNEPRLKGAFPAATYRHVVDACQRMLDTMAAARWLMLQPPAGPASNNSSNSDLLGRAAAERANRDALVGLTMYVLASALVLKTPLPALLPPVAVAQHRVAAAMRDILDPPSPPSSSLGDDARLRYVFYYEQVMLARHLVSELAAMQALMRDLYGSTGPADALSW